MKLSMTIGVNSFDVEGADVTVLADTHVQSALASWFSHQTATEELTALKKSIVDVTTQLSNADKKLTGS